MQIDLAQVDFGFVSKFIQVESGVRFRIDVQGQIKPGRSSRGNRRGPGTEGYEDRVLYASQVNDNLSGLMERLTGKRESYYTFDTLLNWY